jgi:DNA-binding transcriptional regulator YiaG
MTPFEIKSLRLSLGWTQSRLAEACGVTVRAVKQWEQGRYRPGGSAQILLRQQKSRLSQ